MTTEKQKVCYRSDGTKKTGKRIIETLEKTGGVNIFNYSGMDTREYYYCVTPAIIQSFKDIPEGYIISPLPPDKEKPKVGMSLRECKDKIAQNHDYKNWSELTNIAFDQELNFDLYKDCLDEAAELYASQQVKGERWVSVEVRKPEDRKIVLVYYPYNKTSFTATYFKDHDKFDVDFGAIGEPSHWRELPPPPSTTN